MQPQQIRQAHRQAARAGHTQRRRADPCPHRETGQGRSVTYQLELGVGEPHHDLTAPRLPSPDPPPTRPDHLPRLLHEPQRHQRPAADPWSPPHHYQQQHETTGQGSARADRPPLEERPRSAPTTTQARSEASLLTNLAAVKSLNPPTVTVVAEVC